MVVLSAVKKLVAFVVVLAVLWLGVEIVAPQLAEARIEARVRARVRSAAGVSADIESFPMVTTLLLTENVRNLAVSLAEVAGERVTISRVNFALEGVELDRQALARREVEVRSVDSGVITAEVTQGDLSEALGVDVELRPDAVSLSVDGASVEADVDVSGRSVQLAGAGRQLAVTIPQDLMPCEPEGNVEPGRVVLSCTIDEVPSILVRAVT